MFTPLLVSLASLALGAHAIVPDNLVATSLTGALSALKYTGVGGSGQSRGGDGTGGQVSVDAGPGGTVTGTGGTPLDSVGIDIHRVLGGGDVDHYYEWAFTESDGTWSADLPPGSYLVEFNAEGDYLGQWFDGASSEATATEVVVGGSAVTGIDAQLQPGGVIAGTVTGPGGAPEPEAYVSVYRASATSEFV